MHMHSYWKFLGNMGNYRKTWIVVGNYRKERMGNFRNIWENVKYRELGPNVGAMYSIVQFAFVG